MKSKEVSIVPLSSFCIVVGRSVRFQTNVIGSIFIGLKNNEKDVVVP